MTDFTEILGAVREHILFLRESGVQGIPFSADAGAGRLPQDGPSATAPGDGSTGRGLEEIRRELGECMRCPLGSIRRNIVFGEGNPHAEVVFVGEGPGEDEDETGRPFVGRAGRLLTKIIENGMRMDRAGVYICNVVKCRPPGNRTPRDEEVDVCLPFLKQQIVAIRPKAIVTLGLAATHALLGVRTPMKRLRGQWHEFQGIPLMPTFHPSYVLRYYTHDVRKQVHEDTQQVVSRLKGEGPGWPARIRAP